MIWGSDKGVNKSVEAKRSTGSKSIFKVKKPTEISPQLISQITNVETVMAPDTNSK
jgi:hypothetical protein